VLRQIIHSSVTAGLALFSAGCSLQATSGSGARVRPIDDILTSGPEFFDIGPETAALRVETTLPVVCAVVYGTTPEYGQMATDTDMAGGGHSDHHPLLTGLTPDTLYYARLQGVGPDGTLYRSEQYTFRTSPATSASAEPNLALPENGARLVGVSSNFDGGSDDGPWGALSAFDGEGASAWSSDGDGDEAWIEIELAAVTRVTRIGFWTRTMGSSAQIQSFQIVSDAGETVGPFNLTDAAQNYYFDTNFTARRLRFEVVASSDGNTGAVEIEVYGEPED
jgi:hypothetical protein